MRHAGKSAVCLMACIALAGCALQRLEEDLSKLDDIAHLFTGGVTTEVLEFHSTLVVAMEDRDAERVRSFRMMSGPGTFEIRAARSPHYFFAFADLNKDLRFQSHEPYGWAGHAAAFEPTGEATRSIDIVITDQQMPEMTGVELCRELRNLPQYASCPIILLTAKGLELELPKLRDELGIDATFAKPFSPSAVVKACGDLLLAATSEPECV